MSSRTPHKREIRQFHVAVGQWRQSNAQKSVKYGQSFCFADLNLLFFAVLVDRELKQQRRRQREQQKAIGLDRQNNSFARASRFFVHFLSVTARLRHENA